MCHFGVADDRVELAVKKCMRSIKVEISGVVEGLCKAALKTLQPQGKNN